MNEKTLHLLILEDNPDDAELAVKELEREGFTLEWSRVDTEEGFREALSKKPDLILADYKLPSFSGLAALEIRRKLAADIPSILISGTIGEEAAVECMKSGATDYVLKDRLSRLVPVVKRALKEAEVYRERKRAEEALWESEKRYRELVQNANSIILRMDPNGCIIFFNEFAQKFFGYTEDEILGKNGVGTIVPETDTSGRDLNKMIQDIGKNPEQYAINENENMRRNGERVWIAWTNKGVFGKDGRITEILCVGTDITERKEAEEVLKEFQRYARGLIEANLDALVMISAEGKITDLNHATELITGLPRKEIIGTDFSSYFTDPDAARKGYQQVYRDNYLQNYPLEIKHRDGKITPVLYNASVYKDAKGNVAGVFVAARDITKLKQAEEEKKKLEAQFQQSQKMEAIGRLAGGVAHDFNNILTIIIGNAELLSMSLGKDSPLQGRVEEISKGGERAASLTRQLLAFSRRQMLEKQVLDLNGVIPNMDKMLRRLIGEDIDLKTVLAPDLGRVEADPGQIEQVIMNLAVNARDAMPTGGKLTIETANVDLDETYVGKHVAVKPGPYIMMAISDTGTGMDEETRSNIFEPFFTTKEKGSGTGLGLSTVYGIVKQSGGNIWVYSEPEKGTTFKIYLPRVEKVAETAEKVKATAESLTGSETIMVVEDDKMVRDMARSILQQYGYSILDAPDGKEALRVSEKHEGPIHLMLTDVVMPGMSGRVLAEQLAVQRPKMKVLYMSGYTDNAIVHHGVLDKEMILLQKPFTMETLAKKVREVLDK